MDLHKDRVYGIAWHLTHRREDALDVTQESFVRMWSALPGFKGKSSFATWLHRIVLNTGIDYIRRESRHGHHSLDGANAPDGKVADRQPRPPEPSSPAAQRDAVYSAELQRSVLEALTKLSQRQRQVFVLRYYHGLSFKEIAEVISASEGTVKQHLARAQAQLKQLLAHLKP